jgi:hypothetical protein
VSVSIKSIGESFYVDNPGRIVFQVLLGTTLAAE